MKVPTVHLNGTSQEDLINGLMDASGALSMAIQALKKIAPNGRDFYPQGNGALDVATGEHNERVEKLLNVYRELVSITGSVADQKTF